MTAENFAYWLQGFFELNPDLKIVNESQTKMIREHLQYVFNNSDEDVLDTDQKEKDLNSKNSKRIRRLC